MKKLTQEQKIILIAEANGYVEGASREQAFNLGIVRQWKHPVDKTLTPNLPMYFGSLEIIHAVVKGLDESELRRYHVKLVKITSGNRPVHPVDGTWIGNHTMLGDMMAKAIDATAAQRAEAYGQARKLWEAGQ